jgi:hypothetical protein
MVQISTLTGAAGDPRPAVSPSKLLAPRAAAFRSKRVGAYVHGWTVVEQEQLPREAQQNSLGQILSVPGVKAIDWPQITQITQIKKILILGCRWLEGVTLIRR